MKNVHQNRHVKTNIIYKSLWVFQITHISEDPNLASTSERTHAMFVFLDLGFLIQNDCLEHHPFTYINFITTLLLTGEQCFTIVISHIFRSLADEILGFH